MRIGPREFLSGAPFCCETAPGDVSYTEGIGQPG